MEDLKKYKQEQFEKALSQSHEEASRANKVGKRLAKKALTMVDTGESTRKIRLNPFKNLDYKSTTLALKAELKQSDVDIDARVSSKWEKGDYDYGAPAPYLEIHTIDGKDISRPEDKNRTSATVGHTGTERSQPVWDTLEGNARSENTPK